MGGVNNLSFSSLRQSNVLRCVSVFHAIEDWSATDWACAMAGECGEACNQIKKLRRLDDADSSQDNPVRRSELVANVASELADLVIYADLLAARLNIELGQAVADKFNEVSDRRGSKIKL